MARRIVTGPKMFGCRHLPDAAEESPSVRKLSLAETPRILLLESFRDLRVISEAGEGYDPDWRDKLHA